MRHKDATSMIPNLQDYVLVASEPFPIRLLPHCLHLTPSYTTNTLIPVPQIEFTKPPSQIIRKALSFTNNRTSGPTPTHPHALRG